MSKSTALRKRRPESRDVWLERIERYRAYRGTQASFCRLEGITPAGLNYWLGRQRSARAALATASGRQAFAKVELVSEAVPESLESLGTQDPSPGMPDPRWVAEFVRHLMASGTERWS
jgi:hypothetical protein